VIEGLYRDLVAYSVSEEHKKWEELNGSAAPHRVNSGTLPHG
jgi:hypothetical protein